MYKNKNIIVSGASRGVGFEIACHFLKNGANVIGLSRGKGNIENQNYKHYSVDLGNPDSLLEAAKFIQIIENRQGIMIGEPSEVAKIMNWI